MTDFYLTLASRFKDRVSTGVLNVMVDDIKQLGNGVVTYLWDGMMPCAIYEVEGVIFDLADTCGLSPANILLNGERHASLEVFALQLEDEQ